MKKKSAISGILLTALLASAAPVKLAGNAWDAGKVHSEPAGALHITVNNKNATPAGGAALEVKVVEKRGQLWLNTDFDAEKGVTYTIRFAAKSTQPGPLLCAAYQGGGDWLSLGKPETFTAELGPEWREFVWNLTGAFGWSGTFRLPAFTFDKIPVGGTVSIGPVTVEATGLNPDDPVRAARKTFQADTQWRPIVLDDLYVKKGSALDLSELSERVPCGTYGRVVAGKTGRTVFEKRPEMKVRFFGYSFTPTPDNIGRDKPTIEAFADALMTQGYNMVRFHGVNGLLMSRHRYDGRLYDDPATIPFIAENEDIFHYFVYCLKQRGIYLYLDLATFSSGWTSADIWGGGPANFGAEIIAGNAAYRKNYRAGVLRMLSAVNPYTQMTLAEDPTLAIALFWNEENLRWSKTMPEVMHARWIGFLKRKYGTPDKLRAAWPGLELPENLSWETVPPMSSEATQHATKFSCDMAECIVEAELETTRWYETLMAEAGYRGLTTQWDFIYRLSEVPPRAAVPAVSMHAYHAHPSDYVARDSFVPQSGVFTSGCSLMRVLAPVRFIDRPYLVSEYGIVGWNRFRHEQGLASAYGALQDWDLMMVHAVPVAKKGGELYPFYTANDIPIRAAEVVTAFAYLRGDVKSARNTVVFPLDDAFIFQDNRPFTAFNGNLAFLFAVSRIGIRYGNELAKVKADLELPPLGDATFSDFGAYGAVGDSFKGGEELNSALRKMRDLKLIGADNRTDPARGVYQSDTGEITMYLGDGGLLDVITPQLEGSAVKANKLRRLGMVTVTMAERPAALTVISRTAGQSIADADRLLVVCATDAVNSGMTFTDASRQRLVSNGNPPVLVQTGKFELRIRNNALTSPVAYALKLNGERADRVPVRRDGGELVFAIDTAALPEAGPTPFFELVNE